MKSFKQIVGAGFGFLKVCGPKLGRGLGRNDATVILAPQGLYFLPNESRSSAGQSTCNSQKI